MRKDKMRRDEIQLETKVSSVDQGDEGVPAAICGAAMQAQDVTKNVMSWQRMSGKTNFGYTNFFGCGTASCGTVGLRN